MTHTCSFLVLISFSFLFLANCRAKQTEKTEGPKTVDLKPQPQGRSEQSTEDPLKWVKSLLKTEAELKKEPYRDGTLHVMRSQLNSIPQTSPEYQEAQAILKRLEEQAKKYQLRHEEPEIDIRTVMLKPRGNLDTVLGRPIPEEVGDCDNNDVGYVYSDESYVCTRGGNIVVLSYQIKRPVHGPGEALKAVGINQSEEPIQPFPALPNVYVWLSQRGNALEFQDKTIPAVRLTINPSGTTIQVDMTGARKRSKYSE